MTPDHRLNNQSGFVLSRSSTVRNLDNYVKTAWSIINDFN